MFLIIPNNIVIINSVYHNHLGNILDGSFFNLFIHICAQFIIYIIRKGITIIINKLFLIACFILRFKSENIALVIPHPGQYNPVIL